PRSCRILCFSILTPLQFWIILSANYTFLNYLVLVLGFLLLDDKFLRRLLPQRWRREFVESQEAKPIAEANPQKDWRDMLRPRWTAGKRAGTTGMHTWLCYETR